MRKEWRKKYISKKKVKKKKKANLQQIKWLIYEGKIAELQREGRINKKKPLEIMKKKQSNVCFCKFLKTKTVKFLQKEIS